VTRFEPTLEARRDWLRLARTENVGAVTFEQLIQRYGDAARALEELPELARRGGRANPPKSPTVAEAAREIAAGESLGARLLINRESAFPRQLAAIDGPPPLIWARGEPALLSRPAVAIVGARNASAAGQRFARTLAEGLGQAGYVIVSGMARGIDAAAHDAALSTGTVAVLAGGVDDIYPPENTELYARLAARGCLVSESAVGYRAQARDFPRRNRLISGLSLAIVVVEAEMRSGSLITARLAGEQGREVFAVPGSPLDPRTAGCLELLRQGASICAGVDDVLRVLETLPRVEEPPAEWAGPAPAAEPDDTLRRKLEELLSPTPITRDDLVRTTGAPAAEVAAALMELALAGKAELLAGGLVVSP
jgi:DNA processing protein